MSEFPKEVRDAVLGTYAAWLPYAAALAEVDASFRDPDADAASVVEVEARDPKPPMAWTDADGIEWDLSLAYVDSAGLEWWHTGEWNGAPGDVFAFDVPLLNLCGGGIPLPQVAQRRGPLVAKPRCGVEEA